MIATTLLVTVGGLLVDKGLGFLKDLIVDLSKEGIKELATQIIGITGVDIRNEKELAALTPQQAQELREKLLAHYATLYEIKLKFAKLESDNVSDARQHNLELAKQRSFWSVFTIANTVALIWTFFSVIFLPALVFCSIPADNVRFADTILGFILGTIISTIVNFLFGGSVHDRRNVEQYVADATKPAQVTQPSPDIGKPTARQTFK